MDAQCDPCRGLKTLEIWNCGFGSTLCVFVFRRVRKNCDLISSYLSVRPHGTTRLKLDGFPWNLIFKRFLKYVEKIKVSFQSNENDVYFTRILCTFMIIYRWILLYSYY